MLQCAYPRPSSDPVCFRSFPGLVRLVLVVVFAPVLASCAIAKSVEIAGTGYRLTVPDTFTVSQPVGAPNILLQADRPDGNGTIQVVRDDANSTPATMAANYENKMRAALGNLQLQGSQTRTIAGRPTECRSYVANANGMRIRVQAVFYADGTQGFVVHSIDTAGTPEFETALASLSAPARSASIAATPAAAVPAGAVALGNSGFVFTPPPTWAAFPGSRPNSQQFGLPDKSALTEVMWVDVDVAAANPSALLDQTLAQLESGFGTGWSQRERAPNSANGVHTLFKRFGGNMGNVPAELQVYATTDGTKMVIGYGYYAEAASGTVGQTMRTALLGIAKPGSAAAPAMPMFSLPSSLPAPASTPAAVATPTAPPVAAAPITPATPGTPAPATTGMAMYRETTLQLEVPHPTDWVVEKSGGSVTIAGPQGTPAYDTTINLQALQRSDPRNRDLATAIKSFSTGLSGAGARIDVSESCTVAGAPAHRLYALAKIGHPNETGFTHIFRYLLIERPQVVAVISYVSPIDNWEAFLPIVEQSTNGIRAVGSTTAAPAGSPVTATAGTSVDAWNKINRFAKARDWEMLVEFLDADAVAQYTLRYVENFCKDSGVDLSGFPTAPLERLRRILERVPATESYVKYLQVNPLKITTREENENLCLVMVQWGTAKNQETYYWMKRINGNWKHTPN